MWGAVPDIGGSLAYRATLGVIFFAAIAIMLGPYMTNAELSSTSIKYVELGDLPTTLTFSEPTNLKVGTETPALVKYIADVCMPIKIEGLAKVEVKNGVKKIIWKIELKEDFQVGNYQVIVRGEEGVFTRHFRIHDSSGNSEYPKIDCNEKIEPIIQDSNPKSANFLGIFGDLNKDSPASLDSLIIVTAISAASLAFVFYTRRTSVHRRTFADIDSEKPSESQSSPAKILHYGALRIANTRIIRTILNNIAIGSTYLLIMSFISTSGALLIREYFITRFNIIRPSDFKEGQWLDLFFEEGFLLHVSSSITHPNLYLFYGIFLLPFMIGASMIWLGDSMDGKSWAKKIRNLIIFYSVVIAISAILFMILLALALGR